VSILAIVGSHRSGMLGLIDMRTSIDGLRMLVRLLGAVLIVLGLLFWSGNALTLIPVHMLAGILLILSLWTLALLGARGGEQPGLVARLPERRSRTMAQPVPSDTGR
jgi:hypothetical protein